MLKMVEEYYLCKICDLKYREKELAEKCQAWCEKHDGQCDPEITKYAVIPSFSLEVK
jgi:hypothetical protein